MKERLLQLLELFKTARPATRITLVLATLSIFAVTGISSWYANRPDLVQLWSGLNSGEAAEYKKALAQAGIPFRSSPPPENGIWVDASQRTDAEAQVALGGYLPTTKGIQTTDGGMDSAFLSARTRNQMADKREWQECEIQLERLNFIEHATVCSSNKDHSAFTSKVTPTISVTLGLRHGYELDESQARTVATLVRTRFNVPLENITIVDEHGNLLHDGADKAAGITNEDLYAYKRRYDSDAERRANKSLELALGAGMARVTVNSDWAYEELESIVESALPEASAPFYESKSKSESPGASAPVGGPAGVSSNITQDFGIENAGIAAAGGSSSGRTSNDEVKRSVVGRSTEHRTNRTPTITRLSVALIADESVAGSLQKLEGLVKAAVGYDAKRDDYFESYTTPLASIERDESGAPILPVAPEPREAPNRYMELAIEHGVEILAALAFVFVLLKSLKSVKEAQGGKTAKATKGERATRANGGRRASDSEDDDEQEVEEPIDLELLARAQVEELVRSQPEKVSSILASWAHAADESVGAGR